MISALEVRHHGAGKANKSGKEMNAALDFATDLKNLLVKFFTISQSERPLLQSGLKQPKGCFWPGTEFCE